jgi:hypothetical protein
MRGACPVRCPRRPLPRSGRAPIRCNGIDAMAPLSEQFAAHARRQLDGVVGHAAAGAAHLQRGAAVLLDQVQHLARGRSGAGCGSGRGSCPTAPASARGSSGRAWRCPTACRRAAPCASRARWAPVRTAARRPVPPACGPCSRCCGSPGSSVPPPGPAGWSRAAPGQGGEGGRAVTGSDVVAHAAGLPVARTLGRGVTIAPQRGSGCRRQAHWRATAQSSSDVEDSAPKPLISQRK